MLHPRGKKLIIFGLSHFLQPTYFVIGIMEVALAVWLISERKGHEQNPV